MNGFLSIPTGFGQLNLANVGEWILPATAAIHDVAIFYPPATGDEGGQRAEALELSRFGYASLLYQPPYRRTKGRGLADPAGTRKIWLQARDEFSDLVSAIKDRYGRSLRIVVAGKNLGGSVAAFSVNSSVDRLVVSGAVPMLSAFWAKSFHPAAIEARMNYTQAEIDTFERATREFDLLASISRMPPQTLIQFGTRDPWIETSAFRDFARKVTFPRTVQWVEDDHAMSSPPAADARRIFLMRT